MKNGQISLFDLIGREWTDDAVNSVISHYDGIKSIELSTGAIYRFEKSGIKILPIKLIVKMRYVKY